MSAQRIHQIQVNFSPEEDRLQLRINTQGKTEFRFWLTRRFVKRLWPGLHQAMEGQTRMETDTPLDPAARAAILSFMHEQAISETDFSTQFQDTPSEMPLGPLPVLVTRARIEPMERGGYRVCLHPQERYGIEVAMDAKLMHSFCKLLTDAVDKADWDLSLPFSSVKSVTTDMGGPYIPTDGTHTLN
ncbi:MAG: hypothetical protein HQL87_11890 [Magnetococcales bacterium]|nr:hypothetical protein [Magnetococcales bacterium]